MLLPYSRILVRATNWVGDAVMSLPALNAMRERFPAAHISVLARPWVADLYRREPCVDQLIPYAPGSGWAGVRGRWQAARALARGGYDAALLLPNSFDSALLFWLAGLPRRIGYARDGRAPLLTQPIARPRPGEIPPHESFYYLELLRRAGWIDALPARPEVRLRGVARQPRNIIGVSPGAAFGTAKRWLPERFAEAAAAVAGETGAVVELHGTSGERDLCEAVREDLVRRGCRAENWAGRTTLSEFIDHAAACRLFLTNDSGAMHIATALGVPTVTVFGATNEATTGPAGPLARIVREPVDCAPCLLRECPIDHRCMTRVTAARVAVVALDLLQQEKLGHADENR